MSRTSEGTSENALELLKQARKKFGMLNEAEEKLFRSFADGEPVDYSDKSEENNNPNGAIDWDENSRVIRAECIAWLCTDSGSSEIATHLGIRVRGARVEGELNLAYARFSFPLGFEKSAFMGRINLRQAEIRNLNLGGTHTGPIYGDGLKVESVVFLRHGFKAEGEVRLRGATIGRDLSCVDGQLINKGARALDANGLKVEGNVFLRDGFKAEGEVNLVGVTISGVLDCQKGRFINKGAIALNANKMNIGSSLYLRNGFKAEGEVNLISAKIGGVIDCKRGQFINDGGDAIIASGMKVKGSVYMRNGFKAEGEVSLASTTIDRFFQWRDVNSPEGVTLDLRSASVGTLWDDANSWPDQDKLFLNNFEYREIFDEAPRDAKSRIDWLRRQKGFWPQPYEQLAAVFRKGGRDEDARKILITKNKDKKIFTELTRSEKIWYRVLGPMIGYGYRPLNALWGVAAFVALGWILFGIGYLGGLITPHSESAYSKGDTGIVIPGDDERKLYEVYPRFNFLVYSVDTFVPLIDLHQGKYWLPNANLGHELFKIKGLHTGGLLRLYLWIHILMGWLLSTLLVVGLTGLVRT
jgi:sRNA-binding regulator protein Hfq